MTEPLKGPRVFNEMVFCEAEFLGVLQADGRLLKFRCEEGCGAVWGEIGDIITVLEWAVRLNKIEPPTFIQLRKYLLCLFNIHKNFYLYKKFQTSRYLNEVSSYVDAYWDRLL